MEFGLLGPLVVRDGARLVAVSAPHQRVLLAALLLEADRVVSLDALTAAMWGDEPPARPRGALHSAVQRLRATLGPAGSALIETRPPGYRIQAGDGDLDIRRFGTLAARGQAAAEAGDWARAAGLLAEALGLWRGEALADIPSQVLQDRERARLDDERLDVLALRIDADLHSGRPGHVVPELRELVAAYPLREHFHAQLILGLYLGGRQADALAAYQDVHAILAEELGVTPGPELRLLHQRILAGDPALLPAAAAHLNGSAPAGPSPGAAAEPAGPAAGRHPEVTQALVIPRQLPAATRHFAGRAEALTVLGRLAAEAVDTSRGVVIVTIDGTAGVGKTALAVHFAHQVAGQFPDGQLYVNLRGFDPAGAPMSPGEALRLFLDALGVPPGRVPSSLDAQVALYRSLLAGRRMLVLLDNASDVSQVRPLLPAGPGCMVIVTSRSQLTGLVAAEGACPLTLEVLSDADARELLARRLGAERITGERASVDELIELCARLPLALSIAAARSASRPGLSLGALASDLRDTGARLDVLDAGHAASSVRAVFSWSYEQLDGTTARLFRLLGLHPGPDISAAAAASVAGLPPHEGRRCLGELTGAHLFAEHAPGRYACHDLLRAYAAAQAASAETGAGRRAATRRMLDHYLRTAYAAALLLHPTRRPIALAPPEPGAEPERLADAGQALAWFTAERPVLMAIAAQAQEAGFSTHAWQLAWALARFLNLQGYWHDWAATERVALAAAGQLGDRSAQALAHQRLGFAQARLGDFGDAHAQLRQALSLYTELADQAGQAGAHNALAITLDCEGRATDGLDHARRAMELYADAGDRPGQALAMNTVGWLCAKAGEYQRALTYCRQALGLLHELGNREAEASTLDSLGYAHQQLGNHTEARAWYRRALRLNRDIGSRWGEAETLGHIGDVNCADGRLDEARAAWRDALTILEELHHPDAALVQAKLSELSAAS